MTNRRMSMPVDPSRVRARVRARARPRPRRPRHPRPRASACGRFERASDGGAGRTGVRMCGWDCQRSLRRCLGIRRISNTTAARIARAHGRRREQRARGAISGASRRRRRRRTRARVARRARRGWQSIGRLAHAHSRRGCASTREVACVERAREGGRSHAFRASFIGARDANAEGARREGGD